MLINIYYMVYFGLLDLFIYLILIQPHRVKRYLFIFSFFLLLIGLLLQISVFNNKSIFSNKIFFDLVFFSLALIIIHYATGVQIRIFKRQVIGSNEFSQKINKLALNIFDFIRNKFIYIMVYLYQVLSIFAII